MLPAALDQALAAERPAVVDVATGMDVAAPVAQTDELSGRPESRR